MAVPSPIQMVDESETSSELNWQEYALSSEQIEQFHRDGYLVIRKLYTLQEVDRIKTLLSEAFDEAYGVVERTSPFDLPAGQKFRIEFQGENNQSASILLMSSDTDTKIELISWIGGVKPELLRLARLPKMTIPVGQLLRSRKADHLINQAHLFLANERKEWHQDLEYRKILDPNWKDINNMGSYVKTFVSVDPASMLRLIPESHLEELFLNETKDAQEKEALVKRKFLLERSVYVNIRPGDTFFMHPKLVHKCATPDAHAEVPGLNKFCKTFVNGFSFPGANGRSYPGKGSAAMIDLNLPSSVKFTT